MLFAGDTRATSISFYMQLPGLFCISIMLPFFSVECLVYFFSFSFAVGNVFQGSDRVMQKVASQQGCERVDTCAMSNAMNRCSDGLLSGKEHVPVLIIHGMKLRK